MIEDININIKLEWSKWHDFDSLKNGEVKVPNVPGVYEVRSKDCKECLDIGKAKFLKRRFLNQFILNKGNHSTRDRMKRRGVVFNELKLRFAETENPSAVEEYLHKEHRKEFGDLPTHVKQT